MATSKVTRKQVFGVLCGNADALAPMFEGAGLDSRASIEVLNKALATVSKAAPRPAETKEAAENKATAYKFAGTLDPDALFIPRDVLDAFPILRSSQKATSVVRAGVMAGFFDSHVLTCAIEGHKKGTRVYRLAGSDAAWGDEN